MYDCRADSRFAPSQWETALLCNAVSHWLGTNLESALDWMCLVLNKYHSHDGLLMSYIISDSAMLETPQLHLSFECSSFQHEINVKYIFLNKQFAFVFGCNVCRESNQLTVNGKLLYPVHNEVVEGVYRFHSVHLSVSPSVKPKFEFLAF